MDLVVVGTHDLVVTEESQYRRRRLAGNLRRLGVPLRVIVIDLSVGEDPAMERMSTLRLVAVVLESWLYHRYWIF